MSSKTCSVPGCVKDPNHTCFLLPKCQQRAKIWMENCGIEINKTQSTMICEAHFTEAMINHGANRKSLRRAAIPTLNLPPKKTNNLNPSTQQDNTSNTLPDMEIPSNTINVKISNPDNNYITFMENIIVKSLNPPLSQPNQPMDTSISNRSTDIVPFNIESMEIESSSYEVNNDGRVNSDKMIIIPTVRQIVEPSVLTYIVKEHSKNSDSGIVRTESSLSTTQVKPKLADANYLASKMLGLQNKIQFLSKHPDVLKMLAIKIYSLCPVGYKLLHRTLQLPPVPELKSVFDGCTISTDIDKMFASILGYKSETLSAKQTHCIICIGTIDVAKNLYYDIKRDKLIGVLDVNNIQKPEPAHKILVLTIQGIFTDWKQPIDIAYLNTSKEENSAFINQWIDRNVVNLVNMGLRVRALVYEVDYLLMTTIPRHEIYRKIYRIHDIKSLLKWFFYMFLTHDYIFEGKRAKMQHILDYFELDRKNNPRLSPSMTHSVFNPVSIQDVNENNVLEIISMETAAAMTTYINLKLLQPDAKNTVQLITKMRKLLDILCSNECDNASKDVSFNALSHMLEHKRILCDMLSFLDDFKIVNSVTNKEAAAEDYFVPKFQLTIKSILMIYEDMQRNNNIDAISIKRLSLDNMRSFYNRVKQLKKDDTKLTCKKVYMAFIQSALHNILKPIQGKKNGEDLEAYLNVMQNLISNFKGNQVKFNNIPSDIQIKCSEYNTLDFKNKDTIVLLGGFLLKKCYDRHSYCDDMRNYTFIVLQDTSSICKTILKEIQESICVVPQESFIEFVEMLEIRFRSLMAKPTFDSRNGFINGLLKAMEPVTFPMPCSCFPMLYAKRLYLRVRIYNMLKYNNSCFAAAPEQYNHLIINNS